MISGGSLFQQLLREVPRTVFEGLVRRHQAERYAKGFSCWTQLVSMLFSQLAGADSLREICHGLECGLGRLKHLGLDEAPKRSTLSYANSHRRSELFEEFFWTCLNRFRDQGLLGSHKRFRFRNPLLSLDSTTITLCLNLFPWASFQREKGGIKLHVLLRHDDYLPEYVVLTTARTNDLPPARHAPIKPGSIVVMDRGYVGYSLLAEWARNGIFFVVRAKANMEFLRWESLPNRAPTILEDSIVRRLVEFASPVRTHFPVPLRRVRVLTDDGQPLDLLTNIQHLAARTIAQIYRDRWQVELFFKALNQNLKVKTFVGTSENALRIQIWTALLSLMLLKWLHFLARGRFSLSTVAALLRQNLFTYRDLKTFFSDPLRSPPLVPEPVQLQLGFV